MIILNSSLGYTFSILPLPQGDFGIKNRDLISQELKLKNFGINRPTHHFNHNEKKTIPSKVAMDLLKVTVSYSCVLN